MGTMGTSAQLQSHMVQAGLNVLRTGHKLDKQDKGNMRRMDINCPITALTFVIPDKQSAIRHPVKEEK